MPGTLHDIPDSHYDLLNGNGRIALTTVMPSGQPQSTPVWCNCDAADVLVNTMRGFQKERNMRGNRLVTLLAYDPNNPLRNLEIRGAVVEMTDVGALEHLDCLTRLYLHKSEAKFFGDCVPADLIDVYHPIKVRIRPTRVRAEG
jgi:hypothetical protein